MRMTSLLITALSLWILASSVPAASARADSLSCRSVNGETRCVGSGGLDCRTIDGRLVCAPGAKGSCAIADGTVTCRNGNVTQTFRSGRMPHEGLKDAPEEEDSGRSPREPPPNWTSNPFDVSPPVAPFTAE
jgi:hypothetical protein